MTAEQVLASPYFLVGSLAPILEDVQALRERHGISYRTVFPGDVEAFAPIVAQLAGSCVASDQCRGRVGVSQQQKLMVMDGRC